MNSIITSINNTLESDQLCNGLQVYGICELVTKDNQPHPVSTEDNKQVAPNDRYDGIIYHRLGNDTATDSDEYSFGSSKKKLHTQLIRTVILLKYKRANEEGLLKEWIDKFINLIPDTIIVTDYEVVNINSIQKNTDQDAIFKLEFGEGGYEKHRMNYLIYALEYNCEFIRCV